MPENIILGCLLVLPYASYLALLGLVAILIWSLIKYHQPIGRLLYRQGWLWLTLGFGLNVLISYSPGESALQCLNLIPLFVFYAALVVLLPSFKNPLQTLHHWALGLVLAAIPISLRAMVEFYLKAPTNVARWGDAPWLRWLYSSPDFGHRADSVFGHPNVLANYLVIVFGLGLGLSMYYLRKPQRSPRAVWVYGAVLLMVGGIFCSGSRNGLLVVGLQLILFFIILRPNRKVLFAGVGVLTGLTVSVLVWGIGGRSITSALATASLRFRVWELALDMIPQHPWLGTGLGTFKLLYDPSQFPVEGDFLPHIHNFWLMLAAEAGIPLAIAFTAVVGWVVGRGLYYLLKLPFQATHYALLASYVIAFSGTTGFALFDVAFYDARVNILGWMALAVIQAIPTLSAKPGTALPL